MVGDLHEQGHARGTVVGAKERLFEPIGIVLLIGARPGVVMGADEDALRPIGMPRSDQVDHVHTTAGQRVFRLEGLLADLSARSW